MARTIYWLVCEKLIHDSSGKNSYICVFDQLVASIAPMPNAPAPTLPLSVPCSSPPFTLAMKLSLGEGEHDMELTPTDISGEAIAPPFNLKIRTGQNGMSFVNINFGNGMFLHSDLRASFFPLHFPPYDLSSTGIIIHTYINIWLKEADLPGLLSTDPAGGKVGYRTVLKMKAHIGYIDIGGKYRHPYGINSPDG